MTCPRCGHIVSPADTFCTRCGLKLSRVPAPNFPKTLNPIQHRPKRWPLAAGLIMAFLALAEIATLILLVLPNPAQIADGGATDELTLSSQLPSDLVFDDSEEFEMIGDAVPVPVADSMTPTSGVVGAVIKITGTNMAAGYYNARIGDIALDLYHLTDEAVEFIVPTGVQSGDVILEYAEQTINIGRFEVTEQQKTLLAEQVVNAVEEVQTVAAGDITVLLTPNAIDTDQMIRIESIENPGLANLTNFDIGAAFSVTVGDVTEFNDVLVIEYTLPENLPGEPTAAYFDEDASVWRSIYSEVTNGTLYIQTDHLTDFVIMYYGEAIYSPDGYFKIFYQENDVQNYGADMHDLAQQVGQTLEEIRKDYELLPAAYREDYSYLGFKDAMDVYIDAAYEEGAYKQVTNNILLPTTYNSKEEFETTLAHELFHAYQDAVWNEIAGAMAPYQSSNDWIIEATAELASYELAYPEENRDRELSDYASPQKPMRLFDNYQEYDMSCFLSYLLKKTNSTFVEMWTYIAPQGGHLEIALTDFFKSKSADFLSLEMSYIDFCRDVIDDADAPQYAHPAYIFNGRLGFLNHLQHLMVFSYNSGNAYTAAYGLFSATSYSENMPLRIFNVGCTGDSGTSVSYLERLGIKDPNELNTLRISGGESWGHLYPDESSGETHRLFTFIKDSQYMVLFGFENFYPGSTYSVVVSEIQAQCSVQKLEDIRTGKEIDFTFAFKDIFNYVTEAEVVVDFGDGTTLSKYTALDVNVLSGHVTHKFGELSGTQTTISLYDVSGGNKELVCQYVIPIAAGENVKIGITPNNVFPEETVYFSTNIEGVGYTYQWSFGDGTTVTTSAHYTEYAYTAAGAYTAFVTVIDENGSEYGADQDTVTVEAVEVSPEVSQESTEDTDAIGETQFPPDPALVGTWQYVSELQATEDYLEEGQEYYFMITLHLYEDWTFSMTSNQIPVGANAVASSSTVTGIYDYRNLYEDFNGELIPVDMLEFYDGTTLRVGSFDLEKIS